MFLNLWARVVEFQVTRTYCLDSWVEAKRSRRLQVPACSECARAMLAYPRYQLLAAGYSTKESFEMVTRSLQERKAYSRRQGLRTLGRGVVYSLVGLVLGCLAPGALVLTMGPGLVHSLSGLRRLIG